MKSPIFDPYIKRTIENIKSLSEDERRRISDDGMKKTDEIYASFKEHYSQGNCHICKSHLKSFSPKKPCLHWLLRPKGFKKKHFSSLFNRYGYFQMEVFARWVTNLEDPVHNINDLEVERRDKKIFETTIKYKHIEWSFSCSPSDLEGHKNSPHTNFPHFHFQMRLDKKPFINYTDFHVPFKDEDIWKLAMINQTEIPFEHHFRYGEGMQSVMSEEAHEFIMNNSVKAEDESEATYKFDTIVHAKPGQTISGDDIAELIEESKKTGVPFAKLAERLDADVQVIVKAGDAVPDIASRKATKRNK